MGRFTFEIRFDELPPETWLSSFLKGGEVVVGLGLEQLSGKYKITAIEITFQDVTPRFKTRMVFMRQGPL